MTKPTLLPQTRWFIVALILLAGCGPTPVVTRTPVTLNLAVSSAMEPLMADLTTAYRATHPHVSFNIRYLNSEHAMQALWSGDVELAAISWLTDTESIWLTPVAMDGVAVVVHPSSPVKNLSLQQLRDVFRGRVAEWPDVGGPPGEIAVASREGGSGTRARFEDAVMEGRSVTVNAIALSSERAMLDYVSSITTSIGYMSSDYLTNTVRAISVEDVPLTIATVTDRRYPLSRPLLLVALDEPQGELRQFVAWTLNNEGQTIVGKKHGRVK